MPYYKEKDLLFIHIPKTGGTMIEDNIKKKYKQSLYNLTSNKNFLLKKPFNNSSLQHLFYTTIFKFQKELNIDFKNIKIFSVVRNPYDRIISDLFWFKLINPDFSSDKVYNIIKNKYLNRCDLDNHNKPQYKFITNDNDELVENIKIFKTENLNDSVKSMSQFLGFDINIIKDNVNKNYDKYLNKDSISLINNFYKKDFELFGYKMK